MKKIVLLSSVLLLQPFQAFAADDGARLAKLEKQLMMLQSEVTKLRKEASASKRKGVANSKGGDSNIKITMKPSPKIETADGAFSFKPAGRVHADLAVFDDDKADHPDGTTIRRARIGASGKMFTDFKYKLGIDFGNKSSSQAADIKDAYVAYTGSDLVKVKIGHFKKPASLVEQTSSNNMAMIERSSANSAFTDGRSIGIQAYNGGDNHSWALGAFGEGEAVKSTDDEAKSVAGRITVAPINKDNAKLHLGAWGEYGVPGQATSSVAYDAKALNSMQTLESVETGTIGAVDNFYKVGAEAAAIFGPASVQGEYMMTKVDRDVGSDLQFDGWYASASYFLTGESKTYKASKGTYGRLKPNKNFDPKNNGWGALEAIARYDSIDLTDDTVLGGEMDNITVGMNWYLNPNVRLMANYIWADTDDVTPQGANVPANDDPSLALLRAQFDF